MSIKVRSDAFEDGHDIPVRYTKEGDNVSPPLRWEGLPPGTKEVAIICEDPDAPQGEPFVHWVAWGITGKCDHIPAGIPQRMKASVSDNEEVRQGENSFHDTGYDGPMPPPGHGVHHYHFKVYALDHPLRFKGTADNKTLVKSMEGHVLDSGEIVGTYERK